MDEGLAAGRASGSARRDGSGQSPGAGESARPPGSGEPYVGLASVYDRLMADMPYDDWFLWLEMMWLKRGRPASLVDLGCGTGTIAIPLAQSGIDVVGLDKSEEMLREAARKEKTFRAAAPIPGKLRWLKGDMRHFSLDEKVEGALSICDGLNYLLHEDDLLSAFRSVHDNLKSGGWFLFDMLHRNHYELLAESAPFCLDEDDLAYIWNCRWDAATGRMEHRLSIFAREGERYSRIVETHVQRYFSESVVRDLLSRAGFRHVESYADFSFEPIDEGTTVRMFFAALKDRT